jgi:hypothetical protein
MSRLALLVGSLSTMVTFTAAGQLASPRDTTRATIGSATILVDYGRPSKRGRKIIGELVPFGSVWRTGANEATTVVTNQPLKLGTLVVPAGKHTIWTLPGPTGWKLIINNQTGQWGTDYDPKQDLGRVDMQVSTLPAEVEKFTIKVTPAGAKGGVLALEWETTRVEMPFTIQ